MYEKIKNYIGRYSWVAYLVMAGIACAICWIIYGGSSDNSSTVEHMERAQGQQRKSLELNQTVEDAVERVSRLNQQASERITRIEVYQQQASERIEEGTSQLNEAAAILERNAELIERVEQRHQTKQGDGATTTPPTEHVDSN